MDSQEQEKEGRRQTRHPKGGSSHTLLSHQEPEEWKPKFLEKFSRCGLVCPAAKAAGVSARTVYRHRSKDEDFAAEFDEALYEAMDWIELEAQRRAVEGVDVPVMRMVKGEYVEVARVKKYSDSMLCFLLRSRRPEIFDRNRETHRQAKGRAEGNGNGPGTKHLTLDEWEKRKREAGGVLGQGEIGPSRSEGRGFGTE